ncbi:MAG: hypothetical protein BWY64_04069 [bacterium ADurb.Bin363]|nr:MAG: hypothetical protein BWY64_04069 [bacterium ADurb.Bin363]
MKPVDINSLCDGNLNITNRNRIVARNIYNLEILELDLNKNSCTLKVRTSEKSKKGLEEKAEFTTTIIMRNTIKQPI